MANRFQVLAELSDHENSSNSEPEYEDLPQTADGSIPPAELGKHTIHIRGPAADMLRLANPRLFKCMSELSAARESLKNMKHALKVWDETETKDARASEVLKYMLDLILKKIGKALQDVHGPGRKYDEKIKVYLKELAKPTLVQAANVWQDVDLQPRLSLEGQIEYFLREYGDVTVDDLPKVTEHRRKALREAMTDAASRAVCRELDKEAWYKVADTMKVELAKVVDKHILSG